MIVIEIVIVIVIRIVIKIVIIAIIASIVIITTIVITVIITIIAIIVILVMTMITMTSSRERLSSSTVLLLAFTAKNLRYFYVRSNAVILKCDWKQKEVETPGLLTLPDGTPPLGKIRPIEINIKNIITFELVMVFKLV